MRLAFVLTALVMSSCVTHGGRSCVKLTEQLCDVCPKDDWDRALCQCLSEGTLTAADLPGSSDISNQEAARLCSNLRYDLMYPGPDSAASCKADLEFLKEWDVDACSDLGWSSN
jgi:hypothetical protein